MLYFVDGRGRRVWRLDPATDERHSWDMPAFTAMVTQSESGDLLVGLADGVYRLKRASGELTRLLSAPLRTDTQCADGKVDRQGRFIVMTSDKKMQQPLGGIFRLEGASLTPLDEGFRLANGPCWSPDGTTFYCSDSRLRQILAYSYDPNSGALSGKRIFADTAGFGGITDGATVDRDGRLWVAMCVIGKILCFTSAGTLERVIDMPTAGVSSLMFGGPLLDKLYVTSMDVSLFGHPASPNAGHLFVVEDLDATGLAETPVKPMSLEL
jgi:sugar lactone lactonase YvrE